MSEKLQNIPAWAIIVGAVLILAIAGGVIYKSAKSSAGGGEFKTENMSADQQKRYQEEMMKNMQRGMQNGGMRGGPPMGGPGGGMGMPPGMAGGAPPAGAPGR